MCLDEYEALRNFSSFPAVISLFHFWRHELSGYGRMRNARVFWQVKSAVG
jgi:hypothetical protein